MTRIPPDGGIDAGTARRAGIARHVGVGQHILTASVSEPDLDLPARSQIVSPGVRLADARGEDMQAIEMLSD